MTGPWSVILEVPGRAPRVHSTHRKKDLADAVAWQVSAGYRHVKGAKVYLRSPDSRDQLQVSQRGVAVRDQPELPAFGQDIVVHVPTATPAKARTG